MLSCAGCSYEYRVKALTRRTCGSLAPFFQFRGFAGSSGPSQSTMGPFFDFVSVEISQKFASVSEDILRKAISWKQFVM
jgi:hypothetical protein